jgi:hypothetical protein
MAGALVQGQGQEQREKERPEDSGPEPVVGHGPAGYNIPVVVSTTVAL